MAKPRVHKRWTLPQHTTAGKQQKGSVKAASGTGAGDWASGRGMDAAPTCHAQSLVNAGPGLLQCFAIVHIPEPTDRTITVPL